jgi:hypothetical protein
MRKSFVFCALTAAVCLLLSSASQAADVTPWFSKWSQIFANVHPTPIGKPDFLPGTTRQSMHCDATSPVGAATWSVLKYDRAHHIALAVSSTDSCSLALFTAPPPPGVTLPNADLSGYSTGRGRIHIGSTYAALVAAYGRPHTPRGKHFFAAYDATLPGHTVTNPPKAIQLPETLTFAIDNGRVTAIRIYIDLAGEV